MRVAIAGMHRSGTSMVASLLRRAGIYLGRDGDLAGAKPDNQDGFWEHARFVELNEEILGALGGGWDEPPEPFAANGADVARVRAKAVSLLTEFEPQTPWAWKDPRTTLLLPFWLDVIPGLRVVGCVRNPLEVALSLHRRNNFSYERGLALWLEYNRRLLEDVPARQLVLTHYEAYFADPATELGRVLAECGVGVAEATVRDACAAVRDALRHNRFEAGDLVTADLSRDVVCLYAELCERSSWKGHPGVAQVCAALVKRADGSASGPRVKLNRAVLDAALAHPGCDRDDGPVPGGQAEGAAVDDG